MKWIELFKDGDKHNIPELDKPVLLCNKNKNIMIGLPYIEDESDTGISAENGDMIMMDVVAYMPLPDPFVTSDKSTPDRIIDNIYSECRQVSMHTTTLCALIKICDLKTDQVKESLNRIFGMGDYK